MPRLLSASIIAFCVLPFAALAQLSPDGGPIQVNADRLDVFEKENRAVYVGNVDVLQASARLRSDRLTINFKGDEESEEGREGGLGGGFNSPDTMVAEGDVFYVTPDLRARGDKGVYTAASDTVVFTGNVIISRGEDIAQGECLTLRISAGQSTLGCGVNGTATNGNDRVRTLLTPTETNDAGGATE
ncbi:MAG: LptA/OstA family protein [Pseudomonadota bacterium]